MSRLLSLGLAVAVAGLAASPAIAGGVSNFKGPKAGMTTMASSAAFDGIYGPYTRARVMAFQRANGLAVDGIAGPATLRALGLKPGRTLKLGMRGADVLALQKALDARGYWSGTPAASRPAATPAPRVTPMPIVEEPTPEPIVEEPTPEPTPTPRPRSTPRAVAPTPAPMPVAEAPHECPPNTPTFEIKGLSWLTPTTAGANLFNTPALGGEASLWAGDLGIGGGYTQFSAFPATGFGPWSAGAAQMVDGVLKYRFDRGYYDMFAGYRGIYSGGAQHHFGQLGFGVNRPLVCDWLWFDGQLGGGYGNTDIWLVDGKAGLELRFAPVAVGLGFRNLWFKEGASTWGWINGPVADVSLQF